MSETTTRQPGTPPEVPSAAGGVPPHALLWELATVAAVSRCLHAVAAHGVADAVEREGSTVHSVAARLGLDADALGRVLRALAAYGVFDVDLPHVRHNDASRLLRADHPTSMAAFAQMMGLPMSWDALSTLPDTVRTGRAGIFDLDPEGLFSYLRARAAQAEVFDRAMTAKSHADIPLVLAAHDFARHDRVVDLGGGRGHLLRALVERHPSVEAVLVDLPEVLERGGGSDGDAVRPVAADFFTDPLPAADAYVLMEVIHDWDDTDAVRILSNVRRCAGSGAVLLIVETVLDGRRRRDPATTLDIVMLAVTGGRERSEAEHSAILAEAGWELVGVIPTGGGVQIVEARAATLPTRTS